MVLDVAEAEEGVQHGLAEVGFEEAMAEALVGEVEVQVQIDCREQDHSLAGLDHRQDGCCELHRKRHCIGRGHSLPHSSAIGQEVGEELLGAHP